MTMFDEARVISEMIKMRSLKQSEVAKTLGVSQSYIANKLRLLGYSDKCRQAIVDRGLTERHARAILRLSGEDVRLDAINKCADEGLNVAECEGVVDFLYRREMPRRVAELSPRGRISSFFEELDGSLRSLQSLGVNVSRRISYEKDKTYVFMVIEEQ
ncbi:MAG: hypothetical protein IIX96_02330 [Clostridia bacterium]|nr:hypothetical protein [Clostridia bacterium]